MSTNDPHIDREQQIAAEPASEERGIPQVGRKRNTNGPLIAFATVALVLIALVVGVRILVTNLGHHQKGAAKADANSLPSLTESAFDVAAKPPPPPAAVASASSASLPASASTAPTKLTAAQQAAMDELARRQRSPLMAIAGGQTGASPDTSGSNRAGADNSYGSLGSALQATHPTSVNASTLQDPDLMITQGTFLDCILETAIDSTEPGMTSCELPRNIYSTDGRVLLLARGSRVVGEYEGGQLAQGQKRIFVVWTRVESPEGVVINLDSPSTDQLGRSGLNGRIDNHFVARFGSALFVSIVNDLANYEVAKEQAQSQGGTQLNFGTTTSSTTDLASQIVANTINIKPTLYKNQGGHIGIFVARDLYFGNVYALAPTHASY